MEIEQLGRTARLLSMFDATGFGLEVGPSYAPLLPKSKGYNVEIFDHADGPTLRKKYHENASQIEEVDYVSDGRGLLDIIGEPERYDYIVASHVIEHIPDVVRFLQDCETLLKPDGVLILTIPDKRYCFDTLRPVSTVGQALQAYVEKRTRHAPSVVFDHVSSIVSKAGAIVWLEPDLDNLQLLHSTEDARSMFEKALATPDYLDMHGWQFTPTFFEYLIKTLRCLGYVKSGVQALHTNAPADGDMHEFYVRISKSAPVSEIPYLDLMRKAAEETREDKFAQEERGTLRHEPVEAHLRSEIARLKADNEAVEAHLRSEVSHLQADNAAILASTSWKVTSPLRYLRTLALRS